jgi:sialate O-acetylesterase
MRRVLLAVVVSLPAAAPAAAEVKLNALFSDGVVLQRDREVPVFGTATPGAEVTVTVNGATQTAKAGEDGKWQVRLPAHEAGGPHVLAVAEAGGKPVEVKDVQFGEVWIASGQSNMHWTFSHNIMNGAAELDAANDPLVRQFTVKKGQAKEPMFDTAGKWLGASRENLLVDGQNGCSAVGYFFARALRKELNVPVGVINASVGGTPIQQWSPGGGLYNNMIHPLVPFAVRGAIWYQGEANVAQGKAYVEMTKKQVEAWRDLWKQRELPYYFVQLAPFTHSRRPKSTATPEVMPLFWEGQSEIPAAVPKTDFIVISDLVENTADIHPSNKQGVGARLANLALHHDYQKSDVVYSGPRFKSAKVEDGAIRVSFDHVAGGLASRDEKPLSHFQIAGEDQKFVPAEATIDGDTVVVKSPEVAKPVAVRFAWHEEATPNLQNKSGLPANSFRTDDWPVVTTRPADPAAPAKPPAPTTKK